MVELRDEDRELRLDLDEPAQLAVLRAQLDRAGQAVLTEAADEAGYGWLGGHAHEVVLPLLSVRSAAAPPAGSRRLPRITLDHGQLPGSPQSRWLFARLYAHPDRQFEIMAGHLPRLLAELGDPQWWFLRYRSTHDPDHLRLRIRTGSQDEYGAYTAAVGGWASQLRRDGVTPRLALDTYYPEIGRYGDGHVLAAAEAVFAADSEAVLTQLGQIPTPVAHHGALAAANLVDIACGFLGSTEAGLRWFTSRGYNERPAPAPRAVLDRAVALADPTGDFATLRDLPGGPAVLVSWERRRQTLATHRARLAKPASHDDVLESLLHMHHIRAIGIDRDSERVCRRLARAAALSWLTRTVRR